MVKKITTLSYLEPILYEQEYVHLTEISKKLKENHTTVRTHLNNWEKQGILTKKTINQLTTEQIQQIRKKI